MYNLHIPRWPFPHHVRSRAVPRLSNAFTKRHHPSQYTLSQRLNWSFEIVQSLTSSRDFHTITSVHSVPWRNTQYRSWLADDNESNTREKEVKHHHNEEHESVDGLRGTSRQQRSFVLDGSYTKSGPKPVEALLEHECTNSDEDSKVYRKYEGDANSEHEDQHEDTYSSSPRRVTEVEDFDHSTNPSPPEFVATRSKVDLSHQHVRRREAATLTEGRVSSPPTPQSKFRGNAGMRSVVHQYMQHVEPLLCNLSRTAIQDRRLDYWITKVFDSTSLLSLEEGDCTVEDVVTWAWIFSASNGESSGRRYVTIAKSRANSGQQPLPQFVLLQILRSERIHANSLSLLLDEIESALTGNLLWTKDSGAVLLIRLLRHGRLTSVSCYERIADLAPRILPLTAGGNPHDDSQRLTHFYNRFLSLLALPLACHPFLSIDAQQRAQLKIARSMINSQLRIPLNREGYRALARVQLLHQKTADEQKWSSVKAPSWPPWRRDELGIDERLDYPGRQSRVSKVIKRLLEAGYGPESIEYEAQILGGQDTDKSPTIQTRRLTSRRPLAWIRDVLQDKHAEKAIVDHNVWAARVAATRSVREAWLCFYSYMQVTMDQQRQLRVYHEMFDKLFARTQGTDQRTIPSPGDGKEVFPDPVSARDLVYVPREPPSIDELYAQMLQDGIRPAGRLLASLMDGAPGLKQGLSFINDSTLGDVKKDVLLHPEKYPGYVIRNAFSTLPDYLLASYVGLLTKQFKIHDVKLYWPGSRSAEERGSFPTKTLVKPLTYGMTLLQIWKPTYPPAYHAALEGICTHVKVRRSGKNGDINARFHSFAELWKLAKHILSLLEEAGLQIDLICYRKLLVLARNIMIRAPTKFGRGQRDLLHAIPFVKSSFVKALDGQVEGGKLSLSGKALSPGQQPYWKDVEALIILLGFDRDFSSIIQIWNWLQEDQELLDCVDRGDSYKMQRLLCATRIMMEGSWTPDKTFSTDADDIRQLRQIVKQWEWPEDVDMAEYIDHHKVWFDGLRAAAE